MGINFLINLAFAVGFLLLGFLLGAGWFRRKQQKQAPDEPAESIAEAEPAPAAELPIDDFRWDMKQQMSSLVSQLVEYGLPDYDLLPEKLAQSGLRFPSERFTVVAIPLSDLNGMVSEGGDISGGLVDFVVHSIAERLLDARLYIAITETRMHIGFIVCPEDEPSPDARPQVMQKIKDCMTASQEFMRDFCVTGFRFAVGGLKTGYASINESYAEALQVLEYNELRSEDSYAYFYEDIENLAVWNETGDALEVKVSNCILAWDFETAKELIQNIYAKYSSGQYTPQVAKYKLHGAISAIMDSIELLKKQTPELFENVQISMAGLYREQQFQLFGERIVAILDQLSTNYEGQFNNRTDDLSDMKRQMITYVNENLVSYDLTISTLADHFRLSVSYASKLFKKLSGVGFLNYVNSERIKLVKELLEQTDDNLKTIASKVGYYNDITLIRLFRKHTGITPGKYRKIHNVK